MTDVLATNDYENYFLPERQLMESIPDASRTLFLGDLSYFCSEEDLCSLFSGFGRILTVRVRRGVTGESLMHGFIALDSVEAAQSAIKQLDGFEFMGRNLRVQLSSDGHRPSPEAKDKFVQVHVSFISKQTSMVITEKVLRDIFTPFGEIADVAIKKHSIVQKQHRQSGYGFVYFTATADACQALQTLKHSTVQDITFDCSISHKSNNIIARSVSSNGASNKSAPQLSVAHPMQLTSTNNNNQSTINNSASNYHPHQSPSLSGSGSGSCLSLNSLQLAAKSNGVHSHNSSFSSGHTSGDCSPLCIPNNHNLNNHAAVRMSRSPGHALGQHGLAPSPSIKHITPAIVTIPNVYNHTNGSSTPSGLSSSSSSNDLNIHNYSSFIRNSNNISPGLGAGLGNSDASSQLSLESLHLGQGQVILPQGQGHGQGQSHSHLQSTHSLGGASHLGGFHGRHNNSSNINRSNTPSYHTHHSHSPGYSPSYQHGQPQRNNYVGQQQHQQQQHPLVAEYFHNNINGNNGNSLGNHSHNVYSHGQSQSFNGKYSNNSSVPSSPSHHYSHGQGQGYGYGQGHHGHNHSHSQGHSQGHSHGHSQGHSQGHGLHMIKGAILNMHQQSSNNNINNSNMNNSNKGLRSSSFSSSNNFSGSSSPCTVYRSSSMDSNNTSSLNASHHSQVPQRYGSINNANINTSVDSAYDTNSNLLLKLHSNSLANNTLSSNTLSSSSFCHDLLHSTGLDFPLSATATTSVSGTGTGTGTGTGCGLEEMQQIEGTLPASLHFLLH